MEVMFNVRAQDNTSNCRKMGGGEGGGFEAVVERRGGD